MIANLRAIAIFAAVVDHGTFRAAAKHLGLAPSRISQTVSELENEIGVTLLYRSTRQLSLTYEGRILHEKAGVMREAIECGLDAINPASKEPGGELRVTAPAFVTQTSLMDKIADYGKAFPKVNLQLHFSDRPSDVIKDGFDIAIRAGWLQDSELLTHNIGYLGRLLVANSEYYATKPIPKHPRDLESWDWVHFAMRPKQINLHSAEGAVVSVAGSSHIIVDNADALYQLVLRGMGLTVIPEHLARRGIKNGELVHVLPEWTLQPLGLFVVWPDRSRRKNVTMSFAKFLIDQCLRSGAEN